MFVSFERGRILRKFIGACILYSVAVGAPNVKRDLASEENYRLKKDLGSLSTEFQQILPVQVDFGSLVDSVTQRISGIEGIVTEHGNQLESSKKSKAKLEEEISRLKMQLKEILQNVSREQKSTKEEISQLKEQLKSAGGQKLQTAESIKTTAESIKSTAEPSEICIPESVDEELNTAEYHTERKFVYVDKLKVPFDDAREECKRKGGDLATHFNTEELYYIFSKVIPSERYSASIGGRLNPHGTSPDLYENFEWIDGERISKYDGNWGYDEPDSPRSPHMAINRGPKLRNDGLCGPFYRTANYNSGGILCEI